MTPRPCPNDGFPTATSRIQAETEAVLLKHIPESEAAAPTLQKKAHMQYLVRNLIQGFPTRYMSQDASQPWLMFWTLQSFGILQVALDPSTKQKCVFLFANLFFWLNIDRCQGWLIKLWLVSIRRVGLVVGRDRLRSCCRLMLRCVRLLSLVGLDLRAVGIK